MNDSGPSIRNRALDGQSMVAGVVLTLLTYGALAGVVLYLRRAPPPLRKDPLTYVDAALVRLGKPRDLSFLPHVQATPKVKAPPNKIKVTDNPNLPPPPKKEKEEEKAEPDPQKPLSQRAELFKNLREDEDDRATQAAAGEGSPTGHVAGTAAEASGDPFIREIIAAIGERWAVPSMLTPGQLSKLQAVACLKIDSDGKLVEFKIKEPSGNDLFDGSLNSTLGAITELVKPHGRFAGAALRGTLCPVFTKQ